MYITYEGLSYAVSYQMVINVISSNLLADRNNGCACATVLRTFVAVVCCRL